MAAFNENTDDTHNTPHDTVSFQLPAKGKETRKVLTAALQFVLPTMWCLAQFGRMEMNS